MPEPDAPQYPPPGPKVCIPLDRALNIETLLRACGMMAEARTLRHYITSAQHAEGTP